MHEYALVKAEIQDLRQENENLRFYPEEEGKPVGVEKGTPEFDEAKKEMKARQKDFAKKLASYADCYVMDAFGTAHRRHASTAVIATW